MASPKISKASKWFNNSSKSFKISFHRLRSMSSLRQSTRSLTASPESPPPTPSKTTTREDELKEVFHRFDSDGDGQISALELRAFFASIGEYMSHEDAQDVIEELDTDGDDMLDFDDFLRLMKRESNNEDDLKKAFEMFELEKGDGCITPRGLQRMLQRLGDPKSYDECVAMIQVYDTDGNGVLDFHEFNQMMA